MQNEGRGNVERFTAGGLVTGLFGLFGVVLAIGFGLFVDNAGYPAWLYPALLLAGVLIWVVMLRPAVGLHRDELELRNPFHTRWLPYLDITSIEVKQITVVWVAEQKYVGSGFGRSRRDLLRDGKAGGEAPLRERSAGWLIEDKIRRAIDNAHDRAQRGVAEGADMQVRRNWAWLEIGAVVVLAVATVVLAVV